MTMSIHRVTMLACAAMLVLYVEKTSGALHRPAFGVNEMAWALRYTGEVNRQLQSETQATTITTTTESNNNDLVHSSSVEPVSSLKVRGGSHQKPTLSNTSQQDDDLTLFHAKCPRGEQTGALRWGPDLSAFCQKTLEVLQIPPEQYERTLFLTLLYMDRACSVSTPRSQETSHNLPFCMPRTVHRLTLVAMILATCQQQYPNVSKAMLCQRAASVFGMNPQQLLEMTLEMKQSLGDFGVMVTPSQYEQFQQAWTQSPVLKQLMTLSRSEQQEEQQPQPVRVASA